MPAHVIASEAFGDLARKSPIAVSVLLVLWAHERDRVAWVSQRRLAGMLGLWRSSVYRALALLEEKAWIVRSPRHNRYGDRLADEYSLTLPGDAGVVEAEVERCLKLGVTTPATKRFLFEIESGMRAQTAIVPLALLRSQAWGEVRSSGVAVRAWLLIDAATSGGAAQERHIGQWATELGCAPRTVQEALNRLEMAGLTASTWNGTRAVAVRWPSNDAPVSSPDPSVRPVEVSAPAEAKPPLSLATTWTLESVAQTLRATDDGHLVASADLIAALQVEDGRIRLWATNPYDRSFLADQVGRIAQLLCLVGGEVADTMTASTASSTPQELFEAFHRELGRPRAWADASPREREVARELVRLGDRLVPAFKSALKSLGRRDQRAAATLLQVRERMLRFR